MTNDTGRGGRPSQTAPGLGRGQVKLSRHVRLPRSKALACACTVSSAVHSAVAFRAVIVVLNVSHAFHVADQSANCEYVPNTSPVLAQERISKFATMRALQPSSRKHKRNGQRDKKISALLRQATVFYSFGQKKNIPVVSITNCKMRSFQTSTCGTVAHRVHA
jgi:hypothetical protein